MEYTPSFWLSAGSVLVSLATAVAVWLRKPGEQALGALADYQRDHAETHADDDKARVSLTERVVRIETNVPHLATKADVEKLTGEVSAVQQATERNGLVLMRIENHLLNKKG